MMQRKLSNRSGRLFVAAALLALVSAGPTACNGDGGDDADGEGGSAGEPNETGGTESGSGGDPGDGSGGTTEATGGSGGTADGSGGLGGLGGAASGGTGSQTDCEPDEERTIACASGAADATQPQICIDGSWQDDGDCICDDSGKEYDALTVSCLDAIACDESASPFGGGDGTELDPFAICSSQHLDAVRDALSGHFILARSLDLSALADFLPIGTFDDPFIGTFDGAGRALVALEVNDRDLQYVGLFGAIGDTGAQATLRNLELRDFVMVGALYVGALVGEVKDGDSLIQGVTVEGGRVEGQGTIGGMVGWGEGTIQACKASADVIAGSFAEVVGGLVGGTTSGAISESSASGAVSGWRGVGGLLGVTSVGTVSSSLATGSLTGDRGVGGLVGTSEYGLVEDSCATGEAAADDEVGGLIGVSGGQTERSCATGSVTSSGSAVGGLIGRIANGGSVENSYASGDVVGYAEAAGLVGFVQGLSTVVNTYAVGQVVGYDTDIGGLLGLAATNATTTSSYFLAGEEDNGYGTALLPEDFADEASFVGWDFVDIWEMSTELGRPVLQ